MSNTVQFIGTATTLLKIDGMTILVDPSFLHSGSTYHLGWGVFSKKLVDPVYDPSMFDEIDLVLLTHNHRDHWDAKATEILPKEIPVITNLKAQKFLQNQGFLNTTAIDNGEEIEFNGINITAIPARHGPWFMTPFTGKVIGFGLTSSNHKLWISGDTIGHSSTKSALEEFNPQNAIIYFGGVRVYGIRITFDGSDAINVIKSLNGLKQIIGVHINDWSHFRSKPDTLKSLFADQGFDLLLPDHGEEIILT